MCVFFFKQKTAYEMRISDWSSDVCSSDLSFSLQLFHRPRHVIRAETEVMNMLPHLFQAIAKRSAGAGLNELNFGRMIVDEGGPLHALVFATGKFVIFHEIGRAHV